MCTWHIFILNHYYLVQVEKLNVLLRCYCNFVIMRTEIKYKIVDFLEDFKWWYKQVPKVCNGYE